MIYYCKVDDAGNASDFRFLTVDENGNWIQKCYDTAAEAKKDLADLKLRLYEYHTTEDDVETQKWIGYSVPSTESIVDPSGWTEHTMKQSWSYDQLPSQLVYYKTQYAMLYESIVSFVEDLRDSRVAHNVSIVGFADSEKEGTRLYVGGDETAFKTYRSQLYHTNTTDARRTELYQKAMKNVFNS